MAVFVISYCSFCTVTFSSKEAQEKALALSESELLGRALLIKRSNDYTTQGKLPRKNSASKICEKLFLGNLHFDTTRPDLQALFGPFGKVRAIRLGTFEDTDKCKGYVS
jgi:RNA recognition motif-containing protein